MAAGVGSTKITAVVREEPLSCPQDIEQFTISLSPWCAQFVNDSLGGVSCGLG